MISVPRVDGEFSDSIMPGTILLELDVAAGAGTGRAREVIARALELKGLTGAEVAVLLQNDDPDVFEELCLAANRVKEQIYGRRLVLFAPLYISSHCSNDCRYCSFRITNVGLQRRHLDQQRVEVEVRALLRMGHKRLLLVAGEHAHLAPLDYVCESISTAYRVREGNAKIRRINVNLAPQTVDGFKQLKACGIGTYQVFQETYYRPTYRSVHPLGPKSDFDWRLTAVDRAMEAGIDDVGIGVLFGLADHRFEIMALLQHVRYLESRFGVGPHTISIPRLEPATGSFISSHPPCQVSDREFKKLIAILRLAVPYTGLILSTREEPTLRSEALALGISQISAASRTGPGGYSAFETAEQQFLLGDHRSLDRVIRDVVELGYIPSFCTACYRLGRTGDDFMHLAKPGLIKHFCLPNALLTFREYLEDHASEETRRVGLAAISRQFEEIPSSERRANTGRHLDRIEAGDRDLFF